MASLGLLYRVFCIGYLLTSPALAEPEYHDHLPGRVLRVGDFLHIQENSFHDSMSDRGRIREWVRRARFAGLSSKCFEDAMLSRLDNGS